MNPNGLFTYDKVEGTRQTARTVRYNGKSAVRNASGIDTIPVKAIYSAEHMDIDPQSIANLRNVGQGAETVQQIGRNEIARRVGEARQLQTNLRAAAVHLSILDGYLYFDGSGNLLADSTGAKVTIDWGIPAGNRNQLLDSAGSTIIDASWATAGTDILTHVRKVKDRAADLTGYELTTAVYGSNILGYLLGNTAVTNLMQSNAGFNSQIISNGEIPSPFLELNWVRGNKFFWADNDGTIRRPVGADEVVFLPDPEPSWFDLVNCSYFVATNEGMSDESLSGFGVATGPTMYGKIYDDPVAGELIYRDAFLPTINVPNAIFIADTTP